MREMSQTESDCRRGWSVAAHLHRKKAINETSKDGPFARFLGLVFLGALIVLLIWYAKQYSDILDESCPYGKLVYKGVPSSPSELYCIEPNGDTVQIN
jgi:hypothetical protein